MSYNPRPNPSGDTLVASRDQIRTNFEVIQSRFEDNHSLFGSGSGKHEFLQMPVQGSSPTTAANEGGFYSADDSGGRAQLFFKGENSGSVYQLTTGTAGVDPDIATFGAGTVGWTFLPGGLLLNYGTINVPSSTNGGPFTFSKAFSAAPYSLVLTLERGSSSSPTDYGVVIRSATATEFRTNSSFSNAHTSYYIAIGPA